MHFEIGKLYNLEDTLIRRKGYFLFLGACSEESFEDTLNAYCLLRTQRVNFLDPTGRVVTYIYDKEDLEVGDSPFDYHMHAYCLSMQKGINSMRELKGKFDKLIEESTKRSGLTSNELRGIYDDDENDHKMGCLRKKNRKRKWWQFWRRRK